MDWLGLAVGPSPVGPGGTGGSGEEIDPQRWSRAAASGLIGFELDHATAADLDGVTPEERWNGYLLPEDGDLK